MLRNISFCRKCIRMAAARIANSLHMDCECILWHAKCAKMVLRPKIRHCAQNDIIIIAGKVTSTVVKTITYGARDNTF